MTLISITDGQIYLSPSLFELGILPAVDVGRSVSRVGGKAQRAVYRAVAGDLKLAYAQFEELETFARFGARLDEDTRKIIEHGRRIRACLKQPESTPVSVPAQIAVLLALTAKLFDAVPLDRMADAEHAVQEEAANIPAAVCVRFETADKLSDEDRKTIIDIARQSLARFQPKTETKPEAKADPAPKAESKPESTLAAKAATKPEATPKSEGGHESHPQEDAKPKSQSDIATPLSSQVKELRRGAGLTQEQMARRTGVGLRFVRDLEQGKPSVRMDKVNQVLALFGYHVEATKDHETPA